MSSQKGTRNHLVHGHRSKFMEGISKFNLRVFNRSLLEANSLDISALDWTIVNVKSSRISDIKKFIKCLGELDLREKSDVL